MFYQESLFRAFLRLPEDKLENMGYDEYRDYCIMLKEVLKLIHAPYISKDNVDVNNNE